ncbi:MAG: hypothetical protein J6031_05350 [Bacteroidales bacterium]|nr:hypothetical protein [Bacteroidales bacterium]
MKKILLTLAVIATVACFSSCNKKCNCVYYANNTSTEVEYSIDELNEKYNLDIKKCSDMNNVIEIGGFKAGVDCTVTL